jgi:hypothetical protein
MASSASRWKGAGASAFVAMALVALAYRFPATVDVHLGRALEGFFGSSRFYDAEGAYRWSRAQSEIVFPDPGARNSVRVEVALSGFRPPGSEPPRVILSAGGRSVTLTPSRRADTYALETSTAGVWSSTARVQIRSDTFTPGAGDERALGVRVHRARLVLEGGAFPPVKQLLAAGSAAALLALLLGARGGWTLGFLLGAGFLWFRFHAALLTPLLALGALAALALARPVSTVSRGFAQSLLAGARSLRSLLALAVLGLAGGATFAAYALHPRFELSLGTGLAEPLLHRFAGFDRDERGVLFRRPFPGASIDLGDFGARSPWRVSITYAPTPNGSFETRALELPAPAWGFRSGHQLRFPGLVPERDIRVERIEIDRGRSLPPLKVLTLVLASSALFLATFGVCGLSRGGAVAVAATFSVVVVAGLGAFPVFFVPFLGRIALAALASFLVACATRGLAPAGALGIATTAFALWFLATVSPLYSGGHFNYHTSVAEEISQGKFFLYYFPGPDNMLSHQPQWGNLTVPHPSFYHTVTSPLALLPRTWFHLATKLFLALLLFGITLVCATVAGAAGGKSSGTYAALAATAFPTSWQLLELGHLMTIFGTFAAATALGYVSLAEGRLTHRREWLIALCLTAFAFLSYTGSLLFASIALLFASATLLRREPRLSRSLRWLVVTGWGIALALYYIHWVLPFFRETLPAMLSGPGAEGSIDWAARLKLAPGKLAYTFGAFWVPLVGLLGLAFAGGTARRHVLYGWALALPLFSVFDLAFNFLLKHHYFSFPAIAIGFALALSRLGEKGRLARAVFLALLVDLAVTGSRAAWHLATGTP